MKIHEYSIGDPVTPEELATDFFARFSKGDRVVSPVARVCGSDGYGGPAHLLARGTVMRIVGFGVYGPNDGLRAGRQFAVVEVPWNAWECVAPRCERARNGCESRGRLPPKIWVPLFVLEKAEAAEYRRRA